MVARGASIVVAVHYGRVQRSFSRGPEERDIAAIPVATVVRLEVPPDHRLFTSS